jgi:hypothetical protein
MAQAVGHPAADRHEQVKMPVFLPVFCLVGGLR